MKQEKNVEAKKRRLEWEEKQDCLRKVDMLSFKT